MLLFEHLDAYKQQVVRFMIQCIFLKIVLYKFYETKGFEDGGAVVSTVAS